MREFGYLVVGLALIGAGVFLLVRRRELFNQSDPEIGGYRGFWFDFPNHIKMAAFGLALIVFGGLCIYKAMIEWLAI